MLAQTIITLGATTDQSRTLSWLHVSWRPIRAWWRHQMEKISAALAFVRGIHRSSVNHRSPVNFPHKGQWRGALMFSLICVWTNSWANNGDAGDLRRHCARYDVIVIAKQSATTMLTLRWLKNITTARDHIRQYTYCIITLTHWGRVTHIGVSKLTIIGSDNGSSPDGAKPLSEPMLEYC